MNVIEPNLNGQQLRIGIVQARFTNEIGSAMLKVCCNTLQELGVASEDITIATVPGALEVPLILQNMAASEQYDALIAIGVVIRGETYHFELVSNESGAGVTRVGLDHNIPIANAILTTENDPVRSPSRTTCSNIHRKINLLSDGLSLKNRKLRNLAPFHKESP